MITPNPVLGSTIHAVGGISASTCYLPFEKAKWSWGSFWIVQATFAWFLMPLIIGLLTVPELFTVIRNSPSSALITPFLLGAIYGFGGMSFGFAIRYIGFSLTYTISIGISAVLGTITPLMLKGQLVESFMNPGGAIVLTGMVMAISGVIICGLAGYMKENDLKLIGNTDATVQFNMRKGLLLTVFAGILSAVFGISLDYGQPISDIAAEYGAGIYEGNSKIIISTLGCYLTNITWFIIKGIKEDTLKELVQAKKYGIRTATGNYFWSVLGGSLWYFQFFFYGLGHVRMGEFKFASWVIHMSMLIFFSYIVGVIMKEWRKVRVKTYMTLIFALVILILSFVIMTWGSLKSV